MVITILAIIGLYFVIIKVYDKGRKDGIQDAVEFFVAELKKKEIDAEIVVDNQNVDALEKSKSLFKIPFFDLEKSKRFFLLPFLRRENKNE